MSDSRRLSVASRVMRMVVIVSLVVFVQCIVGLTKYSWADSASTGGNSKGGATGSSDTSVNVSVGTSSTSSADSTGDFNANGHSQTGSSETADVPDRQISIDTGAEANAGSTKEKFHASANAWAVGTAGGVTKTQESGSEANSEAGLKTASSWASNGSLANASSGETRKVSASTLNGSTSTFRRDHTKIALSYQADGSFSLAMSSRRSAQTYVGQTTDIGALMSRNINAIMQSPMFASSSASAGSTTAYARSALEMTFSDARSEASARGMSEAFASVTRQGQDIVVTVNASRQDGCSSYRKSNNANRKDCMIIRKVIHLKKGGKMNVKVNVGVKRSSSHKSSTARFFN